MANHLDLEEQEQLDQLKHFWNTWGNLISVVLILVFGAVAAWNGYQYWQNRQASKAAALLDAVELAASASDTARLERAFSDIRASYAGTTQAAHAGMVVAKAMVNAGNQDGAKAALTWVAENASDKGYKALARLRLAGVLLEQKAYDEALKQLSAEFPKEFEAVVADRKGDALIHLNKKSEAVAEYQRALTGFDQTLEYRRLVEVKLSALGVQPHAQALVSQAAGEQQK